jgi:hypothetical protein
MVEGILVFEVEKFSSLGRSKNEVIANVVVGTMVSSMQVYRS